MAGAPTGVGYGVFLGAKLAGYLGVARALKTAYPEATHSTIKVGLTRTGIGVTAGLAYGAIWIWLLEKALVPHVSEMTMLSIYYFALLLPLRVGEWGFTIWLFFDRGFRDSHKMIRWIVLGVIGSYLLDGLALVGAFVAPGGFWIC